MIQKLVFIFFRAWFIFIIFYISGAVFWNLNRLGYNFIGVKILDIKDCLLGLFTVALLIIILRLSEWDCKNCNVQQNVYNEGGKK